MTDTKSWFPKVEPVPSPDKPSVTLGPDIILGVWLDTGEPVLARILHERGERLALDAGLDPDTLKRWEE